MLPFVTNVRTVNTSHLFGKLVHARAVGVTVSSDDGGPRGLGLEVTELVV